nr:RHS repeat-associated core domain-containing protein [uncultured Gimesia sp.]
MGQVLSLVWPSGQRVTWVYDAIGQRATRALSIGTTTYTYNARGNLTTLMNEQSERTTFTYDAAGREIRKQLANGTRASMAYDAAGQETHITHFTSGNTPFSSFVDTYNAAGNRTQRINLDGDVTTWTYDSTSQVLSERYTDSIDTTITTFAYDAVGNRLVKDDDSSITTSVYDAANRLETAEETAGTSTYTYDKNGNQRSIEDPASDITTYSWTYENQMAEIESPNGDLVTFTYAPVNRKSDELRLSKEAVLEFTSYLWDDQNIALELDDVGTVEAEYTVVPQAYGNLISQTRSTDSSFYHFDPLGSTRELTDETETVTDDYRYSVFGEVKSNTGTTVNPYQWVGKEGYYHDAESGLYSLRNRFYGADEGRFKSEDPLGFDAGDENLYRYVANNPSNAIDPSGNIKVIGAIKPSKRRPNRRVYIYKRQEGDDEVKYPYLCFTMNQAALKPIDTMLNYPCGNIARPEDDPQGPKFQDGIKGLQNGLKLLTDLCKNKKYSSDQNICTEAQCISEAKELVFRLTTAWYVNYGNGKAKGPSAHADPVAGYYCWDWENIFRQATIKMKPECFTFKKGVAFDPDPTSRTIHVYLEIKIYKRTVDNECTVAFDDGYFGADKKTATYFPDFLDDWTPSTKPEKVIFDEPLQGFKDTCHKKTKK